MAFDEDAPLPDRLREGDDLLSRMEAADEIERLRSESMTPMAAARVFAKRRREYRRQAAEGGPMLLVADYCPTGMLVDRRAYFDMSIDAVTALWNDLKEASEESE